MLVLLSLYPPLYSRSGCLLFSPCPCHHQNNSEEHSCQKVQEKSSLKNYDHCEKKRWGWTPVWKIMSQLILIGVSLRSLLFNTANQGQTNNQIFLKESEVRNPIIIVKCGIPSSFLAGDQKRKWSQESYHHSWRGTKKKVRSEILSSFLAGDQKESEVRNPIIILDSWPKK